MNEQGPLSYRVAAPALVGCAVRCAWLLTTRRLHFPREHVGLTLRFADGTSAQVFRETVADGPMTPDRCVLVVEFRLRAVRGHGHVIFRRESLLNTPLFAGFAGFVSKLWVAHDEHGYYRGVYEWAGPDRAQHYARCLWRVLALVSVPGSVGYRVVPGIRRDELLAVHRPEGQRAGEEAAWWRLVQTA